MLIVTGSLTVVLKPAGPKKVTGERLIIQLRALEITSEATFGCFLKHLAS